MTHTRWMLLLLLAATAAHAEDPLPANSFADTFGTYGPGGDCAREPRIAVAATGLEITLGGRTDTVTRPDISWTYFGPTYEGIAHAVFPYTGADRPVIFLFNDGETPGTLRVDAFDRGYKGGPPLDPRHQALVAGSPYAKCGG